MKKKKNINDKKPMNLHGKTSQPDKSSQPDIYTK